MKTLIFKGLRIKIENDAGSVRKGVDKDGIPWQTTMVYPYGEILGSMGVDGDPVDVFIGPNKSAKFVYGIYQTTKDGNGFDEQKFLVGFDDAMKAKEAYYKSYDIADHFYTNIETIPFDVFKSKVMNTKKNPEPIHASRLNTAMALFTPSPKPVDGATMSIIDALDIKAQARSTGAGIGEPVTVDGMHGRGVVVKINGRRVTVRFRNGLYLTRDAGSVHSLSENTVRKTWRD